MNFETYQNQFTAKATNEGYSLENINKCLQYAKPLINSGLPVIYNTTHLSALVGYKKEYIKKAVYFTPKFYRDFEIKKKNGNTRIISEPLPSLKDIQLWILENILENIKCSPYAKAYIPNVSLKQNLVFHRNREMVLTIDIENFFGSIEQSHIELIFRELGYSSIISNLLSKLCTKENHLPQGAPTSPYLSNIYFKNADEIIASFCKQHKIYYTRYADDLTFSGSFNKDDVIKFVNEVIISLFLSINKTKTRFMKKNTRQLVTGVVVNDKLQVPFYKRNRIRNTMFYIKKFGFENHMSRVGIKKANYLSHLLGQINHVIYINPYDQEFKNYRDYLKQIENSNS